MTRLCAEFPSGFGLNLTIPCKFVNILATFYIHGSVYRNSYINKIQQDATVCRYLFTAKLLSTSFGCPSHLSSGEHKTVTAASGTGHSI